MKKKAILVLTFLLGSYSAMAVPVHLISTEWLVDSCPLIVFYKIENLSSESKAKNEPRIFSFLKCKGPRPNDLYHISQIIWSPTPRIGDEIVVFFRKDLQGDIRPVFLINMTHPGPFWNYCMNKNGDYVSGSKNILSLINNRINVNRDSERHGGFREEMKQSFPGCKTYPYSHFKKGYCSDWRVYLTVPDEE